jgi:hypothetical protein
VAAWDVARIAIGPTLSVVSFAIGYRRAVSARRERARAAEDDLSKTLLKRVIVDGYRPSTTELGYLLQSKVRQQKVKLGDLPTELQIMQRLYKRGTRNRIHRAQAARATAGRRRRSDFA